MKFDSIRMLLKRIGDEHGEKPGEAVTIELSVEQAAALERELADLAVDHIVTDVPLESIDAICLLAELYEMKPKEVLQQLHRERAEAIRAVRAGSADPDLARLANATLPEEQ